MIGKVSSARRDSLRDVQSKVMEQKPSPLECYVVHVMSAWQAQCLPWQSQNMNPVRYSDYKLETL